MRDMGLIAEVAVQNTAYHFDHLFGYLVPETFAADLQVGCRVMVPFGRGTVLRQAVVILGGAGQDTADRSTYDRIGRVHEGTHLLYSF